MGDRSAKRSLRFENLEPRLNMCALAFECSSLPGADHTIYLDFDGHATPSTGTDWATNGYGAIPSPAFADPNALTTAQENTIKEVYYRVAEDFAPFNVNVTTLEPPSDDLKKTGASDTRWGVRVVITSDTVFNCNCSGMALVDSFNSSNDTPAFVFYTYDFGSPTLAIGIAEAVSHEVGHTLGLSDDGTSSLANYGGHGSGVTSWAPIMGTGYTSNVTQWDNGEYFDSNNADSSANFGRGPDDFAVITGYNGFGYRADEPGFPTAPSPLAVSGTIVNHSGFISSQSDWDSFDFYAGAGTVSLNIDVAPFGANLDVQAILINYTAGWIVIATADDPTTLNATINVTLPYGSHCELVISGAGFGLPTASSPSGYTTYGSAGRYNISGIISNDDYSEVFISDVASSVMPEGQNGLTEFTFTATRQGNISQSASVSWSVQGLLSTGIAPANSSDFLNNTLPSGTLNFGPGVSQLPIKIFVRGDTAVEPDEMFQLNIYSWFSNVQVLDYGITIATIQNDDSATFSIVAAYLTTIEGTGGTRTVSFTVNRSGAIAGSASVRYSIQGIGTTPTNANDFLPVNEWTIDFEANHTTRVVTIHVNTDADLECNEKFRVALSNPIGGTIGTSSTAVGWIRNDDPSNGKVYPKCFSVPKTLSGRSENDEIADYYNSYDGAPAEMIAGLGTDGDWDFDDDYRSEDDAPQIRGVIATSDPLWMVAPPRYSDRGQPSMPGTKSFDAASYFGGLPHGLKDDRKYDPDNGDDRWRELSFAEPDRDRRESADPHTLLDDALAEWAAI